MGSKRRKELCLPSNFCSSHYREMDRFLHQRPCLNPPHQIDTLGDDALQPMIAEELQEYCVCNGIGPATLNGQQPAIDPILYHSPASLSSGGSASHLPRKNNVNVTCKGKEKLQCAAQNTMKADPRPPNTGIKRRQSSSQTRLVEITESQGKEIVNTMRNLSEVEVQKVAAADIIANKQLEYFKLRDKEILSTQRGLVKAVASLSDVLGRAFSSGRRSSWRRRPPTPHNRDTIVDNDKESNDGLEFPPAGFPGAGEDTALPDDSHEDIDRNIFDTEDDYTVGCQQNRAGG
jgi:hypothetical protein